MEHLFLTEMPSRVDGLVYGVRACVCMCACVHGLVGDGCMCACMRTCMCLKASHHLSE